jgi:hypothetical protein
LLNGDNSWLFSFPRPTADRQAAGKAYFHVVSDVWLFGPASDTNTWYSWALQFELPQKAAVQDGRGVLDIVIEIEDSAGAAAGLVNGRKSPSASVDAIFINSAAVDHLHEQSLRTFHPDVPVFATPQAAVIIRTWNYFSQVHDYRDLNPTDANWQTLHPGTPLPPWLSVFRLWGNHPTLFATVIVYVAEPDTYEAILWAPHGIAKEQPALKALLARMEPPVAVPCVMHALHDSYLLGLIRMTTGVEGGLSLVRQIKPKYWVKTQHQMLETTGWFGQLLRNYPRTLESALQKEQGAGLTGELPRLVEVPNGGSFVLE